MKSYLIFSDLDGTFLHHQNYSYGKNDLVIKKLKKYNHQIIFNSSKTFSEIKLILKKLKLTMMPFSCENGATLYFPKTIFKKIKKSQSFENYWKINLTNKNSLKWYKILKELKKGLRKEGLLKEGKFQVTQLASSSKNYGYGVVGEYPEEGVGMNEFLHLVSKALKVKAIRYSGTVERIKKVAVCGGSGSMLTQEAIASGAQAFVTSDIKYHDYFLEKEGFMLLDVGHYESEFPVVEALKNEVSEAFESLDVLMTQRITNPMNVYLSDQELKTTQPPE